VQPLTSISDADLVAISAITGTALRSYAIADELRARGHTVVFGACMRTLLPEEAAKHADAVVVGYAEETWRSSCAISPRGVMQRRYSTTGRNVACAASAA